MPARIHCRSSWDHHIFQMMPIGRQRCRGEEIARQYAWPHMRSVSSPGRNPPANQSTRRCRRSFAGGALVQVKRAPTDARIELLAGPTTFLTMAYTAGFFVILARDHLKVKGAILIGILLTTILSFVVGDNTFHGPPLRRPCSGSISPPPCRSASSMWCWCSSWRSCSTPPAP